MTFFSVVELSFNTVKANYAYIVMPDRISRMLNHKAEQIDLNSIWHSPSMMRMYRNFIDQPATK